jgi:hypothetical protein
MNSAGWRISLIHTYCIRGREKFRVQSLKGQCHEIFDFWFFSWISFPQAPEYTIRAVSNFCENSRRYSQLKVHHRCRWHRWQMANIFKQKNFNYFVWTPLGSRVNININFCLQVHCKMSAAWYCSHYLRPVSLIPAVHLDFRISPRIFEKIRNGPNGILWGWGDSSKKQKQKISWHCPFKPIFASVWNQCFRKGPSGLNPLKGAQAWPSRGWVFLQKADPHG